MSIHPLGVDLDAFSTPAELVSHLEENIGHLDVSKLGPLTLGDAVQSGLSDEYRLGQGAHYTSEEDILKCLDPLFLESLEAQARAVETQEDLRAFMERLERIRVFDPAAGACNFLVIAYRRLREIEKIALGAGGVASCISLAQFSGIEIDPVVARAGRLALDITRQQMDEATGLLSLSDQADIRAGNGLLIEWGDLFDAGDEIFLVGNPPFRGSKFQTPEQKADMHAVFKGRLKTYARLDYAAPFCLKAADLVRSHGARTALVTTNSICQGGSVPYLWPSILEGGVEIGFAYPSFKWTGGAAVTCIIVGLRRECEEPVYLYAEGAAA